MKMTKTAAALALAGIAAAPMAQAEVTLTGYVGIILGGSDADDVPGTPAVLDATGAEITPAVPASSPGDLKFASDDSMLNVAATHEMNNGLTAYGNWRADFGLSNAGPGAGDNIHVGIKGDFGDIRIGEVPDALEYGQVAGDILADIGGEERGISYTGSFGSATVGVNWSPANDSDKIAAGVKFNAGGFGIGLGFADADDTTRLSAGASFSFAGASVGVAFKDFDGEETISAKAGWGAGDLSLALTYEAQQQGDDSKIRFDAGYDLGGDMSISTRVNVLDSDTDLTDYRILFAKSF
jgi:predicted porin